ncbi:MAG: ABC transporter ATP-binding protein [Rhodospirillales bacterium]
MGQSSPFAVHCKGVTRSFGTGAAQVMALRGIDLDVRYGELMMLVGPSGCGKTTLISILAAILDADGGECRVLDQELNLLNQSEKTAFRRTSIGFVFQAYNLLPTLTAAENVAVPLLVQNTSFDEAVARATDTLAAVGLADRATYRPDQLSGGQQQRVAIARALVHKPRLVVCDEPTSALDHRTGQTLMELMTRVALEDGRSLIIVTHDPRIFDFADRIAEMDDGRIVALHERGEVSGLMAAGDSAPAQQSGTTP